MKSSKSPSEYNDIMPLNEATEFLQISRAHLMKLIKRGDIRAKDISVEGKRNKMYRILKQDLIAYIGVGVGDDTSTSRAKQNR